MFNKNVTIFFVALFTILFLNSSVFSKEGKQDIRNVGPQVLNEFDARVDAMIAAGYNYRRPLPHPNPQGPDSVVLVVTLDTLGPTTYDFAWNQIPDQQVGLAPGSILDGIHFAYMTRTGNTNANRFAAYNYYSRLLGAFVGSPPGFIPTNHAGSGWPRVVNGPDSKGLYTYHLFGTIAETHFRIDDGEGFLGFSTDVVVDADGVWPGVDINGNTIVVSVTDNPTSKPGRLYVSTDTGVNWSSINWPPLSASASLEFCSAETSPMINPVNPQKVGLFNLEDSDNSAGTAAGQGAIVFNESADLSSTTTWNNTIAYEFSTMLPDNSYYNPFGLGSEVYSQLAGVYGADGTGHVVFNGTGIQFDANGDTLYPIHPVVYWNSTDQQLIELTDPAIARHPVLGDSIEAYFPGRGWGMGYPNIATGPTGEVIAAWQQPELEDPDNLHYVFGILGGNPLVKLYATDIYAAMSLNNGQTWSQPFKLAGEPGQMDHFPQLGQIEVVGGEYHIHLLWFYDSNPGESINAESDFSEGAWIYEEVVVEIPVGIKPGGNAIAEGFQLRQNYPNPFNPATTISFTTTRTSKVNLEVYNLLGEKVATLVNGEKAAGEHQVQFDASNLSSGLYFYTLTAGDFKQTRKMVLMK